MYYIYIPRHGFYLQHFAKQMFKLPTELAKHLEQEIHTKLTKAVEDQAKGYNKMWAEREAKGEKFHTTFELNYRGRMVEEPRVWREEANAGYIFIKFAMTETKYDYETAVTDYLRPMTCTVDYEGCKRNAKLQAERSIGLFESRVNSHLAITDEVKMNTLKLGQCNLIEGFVSGVTATNENFRIFTKMIWNYRYGANSANGYLTQYVQFRSDRRGARQEGKTVLQRATEAEKQAKADAKQAELVAKNEAKWERFAKLPDQIDRWADKEIKKLAKELSTEGIQAAKDRTEARFHGVTFDKDWYVKNLTQELEVVKHYKKQVQAYLNNEPAVRELFGLDCNNREQFKSAIW